MWTYRRSTGVLTHNHRVFKTGYAPLNPSAPEERPSLGRYTISKAYTHPLLGRMTMNIEPAPGTPRDSRREFRIHGDKGEKDHSAAQDSIVIDFYPRCQISAAVDLHDNQLEVIE